MKDATPREIAKTLGLVPQIAPYTHGFTALELVVMGRYPHIGRFQIEGKEDGQIARNAMKLTETEQFAERTLDTLSWRRASTGLRRSGPGSTTPHPLAGRTDVQP